jgi:hypothetical protein
MGIIDDLRGCCSCFELRNVKSFLNLGELTWQKIDPTVKFVAGTYEAGNEDESKSHGFT